MRLIPLLHTWPWSFSSDQPDETIDISSYTKSVDFRGSPVISLTEDAIITLPSGNEDFLPLGPPFIPPYSERPHRLFEIPQGIGDHSEKSRFKISFRENNEIPVDVKQVVA